MSDFRSRLESFLVARNEKGLIRQLTPDASTREYFRIGWRGEFAIACVYPEPFSSSEQSYLDVTELFLSAGLPVARVMDVDEALGVIVIEDFGDRILRDELQTSDDEGREELIVRAIDLIPHIQAATAKAFQVGSIASKQKFDNEKLFWELAFFKTHYFATFKQQPLVPTVDEALDLEFRKLSLDLERRASVLCHRDFHAANLMLDKDGKLRIIDHQDARIGSVAYDLVSFLLDRVTVPPSADWLADKRRHFLSERVRVGLEPLDEDAFSTEFRLQTIQRCLKAVGTFSYQSVNRGKTYFVPFIKPMFQIVHRAATSLGGFSVLVEILETELET